MANPGMTDTALQFGCLWLNKNLQPLVSSTKQMFILFSDFFFLPKTTATLVSLQLGVYIILIRKRPDSLSKSQLPELQSLDIKMIFQISWEIIQLIFRGENNTLWERLFAKIIMIALWFYAKIMTYHLEVSLLSEATLERLRHESEFSGGGPLFCMPVIGEL